jgi:hypothetical protein
VARRALCVGINDYPGTKNDLPSCVEDVIQFTNVLKNKYGFPQDQIRNLFDAQATVANLREGLNWLFENATSEDRLVFFHSSHGWQQPNGAVLEEVLCLHDGFFPDDELSAMTQALPEGICTIVLDSCHSGGMAKQLFIPEEGGADQGVHLEIVRAKVFAPSDAEEEQLAEAIQTEVKEFKTFLAAPTTDVSALGKDFTTASDEEGQLQANAILHTACMENETASASSSITKGMSAYTWALTEVINERGATLSHRDLQVATIEKLKPSFRQTPTLAEPAKPVGLASRSFITMDGPAGDATTLGGASSGDQLDVILQAVLAQIRESLTGAGKEFNVVQPTIGGAAVATTDGAADPKIWGFLAPVLAQAASTLIPMAVNAIQGKDFTPGDSTALSEQELIDPKIWGIVGPMLGQVAQSLLPLAVNALQGKNMQGKDFVVGDGTSTKALTAEEVADPKIWGFLAPVLAQAASTLIPMAVNAIQGKDFAPGDSTALSEQELIDPKIWGIVGPMLANVAEALLPVATNALRG